jgi:hypothetical protein
MDKQVEVFENEEAAKLLDYFVAYKKLMRTIDFIKCAAASNSETCFHNISLPTERDLQNQISSQPAIDLPHVDK